MKLWRGLSKRILAVSIACALAGLVSSRILSGLTVRDVLLRNTVPVLMHGWVSNEQARCEASPETWTMSLIQGTAAWAYDDGTLASHNPSAPPIDRELLALVPPGGDRAVLVRGWFRGGSMILRSPRGGPCGWMVATWTPRLPLADLIWVSLVGAVLAAGLAAALGTIAVVRPLTLRIARLRRAADAVGDARAYVSAERARVPDELGDLSEGLDRAHERICDDAALLEQRRSDLQRHLDDVTHDLRTPIASLQLALEQAVDAASDPPSRALLHGALKDVVYLGGLTANLRLASQLREGWSPSGSSRVDLAEATMRVASRARILARRGGVALDVAVHEGRLFVRCDPVAAEQAIGNVIDNAVAYGDAGGHVAVVLEREGERFLLRIEDDGPGVRPSELPRLGERTFRSDEARQRDPRGSGLGLAITTEVCERCGWSLAFEAAEPHGLRVLVRGDLTREP